MKKKKAPIKASSTWICETCSMKEPVQFDAIKTHLKDVHKIDTAKTPAHRSMMFHLDGADYYTSTYEVTISGVKLINATINPRRKDDMMRFA